MNNISATRLGYHERTIITGYTGSVVTASKPLPASTGIAVAQAEVASSPSSRIGTVGKGVADHFEETLSPGVQKALDTLTAAGLDPKVFAWAECTSCLQPRAATEMERLFPPDLAEFLPTP